jgi:hypothetical protein
LLSRAQEDRLQRGTDGGPRPDEHQHHKEASSQADQGRPPRSLSLHPFPFPVITSLLCRSHMLLTVHHRTC